MKMKGRRKKKRKRRGDKAEIKSEETEARRTRHDKKKTKL